MSADNWAICPRCKKKIEADKAQLVSKMEKSYGKIPVADFLYLKANADKPIEWEATMREDYEIGVDDDGEFSMNYSCSCSMCGFEFNYEYKQVVPL